MRLAIVGSRTFNDYNRLEEVLFQSGMLYEIECIISGGAKGADNLAKLFALRNNIQFREYPAQWDKYGLSAGYIRNEEIVEACDEVLAFWDGVSKGTKHTIDIAKNKNKKVTVYYI